jgi:MSHA pilin protein MshD
VRRQKGLTLIELIVFIVIVSVGLAGILSVMNLVVRNSADPVLRKQSLAMADAIMEEVLAKAYTDPDGTSGETTRSTMDDVADYDYFNGSSAARRILGSQLLGGSISPLPDTFWASITTQIVTISGQSLREIVVTVTDPQGQTLSLTGHRGAY